MALPYFEQFGWRATVLCVDAKFIEAGHDPLLSKSIPEDVEVVSSNAIPVDLTRKLGIGSLSLRSRGALNRTGRHILNRKKCDLVYFSTTEFGVMPLGLKWKSALGVPYVLDIQDPWVNDHYRKTGQQPPGGKFKHGITQWFAARQEGRVVRNASFTTVVSEHYIDNFLNKYPDLDRQRFETIPFAATPLDNELVEREDVVQTQFDPSDGFQHWVYIGRCGPDMKYSLTALMSAFRKAVSETSEFSKVRMHFLGTDYANKDRARHWVKPIAEELGVGDYVSESPERIPYFSVIRCLQQADALVVPGSDDPRYTASKLYPYIVANRPCLTIFHSDSSVNDVVKATNSCIPVEFESGISTEELSQRIFDQWFASKKYAQTPKTNWDAFQPYTAEAMTKRLVNVFEKALASPLKTDKSPIDSGS
jgi:hypothetical protein